MRPRLLACAALVATVCAAWAAPARALEEVPFVTSPDNVTLEMLRIAEVGPQDFVIDLGSGDGRIVILAAKRFGARGLGVEIVPELVEKSRASARNAEVADRTEFLVQDIFKTDLSRASVVTMYLLPDMNLALRPRLLQLAPGTRIVSHDWTMGDWEPDETRVVDAPDKTVGREKVSRIHRWTVPAQVQGMWCGSGLLKGTQFKVEQKFQHFVATMTRGERVREYEGRIDGATLRSLPEARTQMELRLREQRLELVSADGAFGMLRGASLAHAPSGRCDG